jgi:hypothetical protein
MKEFRFRPLIALILMMCCTLGYAQTFEIDGLTYQVLSSDRKWVCVSGVENKSIAAVNIPSSVVINGEEYMVTSIGYSAFSYCDGLTSIDLPDGVTNIRRFAFDGCSSLTSITIPSSVTNIGDGAFWGCETLTSITIPSSVTSIGEGAFVLCGSLTSINIPSSVTSIGEGAFGGCDKLTKIKVTPGNPVYDSRNNCNAIIETKSNTLIQGCAKTIIPSSVTSIGEKAFSGCDNLTSITIPSSVTSIGEAAFESCDNLTSITIPSSVTSIGDDVFQGCENLKTITIPQHFNDYSFHKFYRWDVQVGAKIIWKGKTDKEPSRSIIYEGPQIDDLINDQTAGGSTVY